MPSPKRAVPESPSPVDSTGRTVFPKKVRDALGIGKDDGHVTYDIKSGTVTVRRVEWHPAT